MRKGATRITSNVGRAQFQLFSLSSQITIHFFFSALFSHIPSASQRDSLVPGAASIQFRWHSTTMQSHTEYIPHKITNENLNCPFWGLLHHWTHKMRIGKILKRKIMHFRSFDTERVCVCALCVRVFCQYFSSWIFFSFCFCYRRLRARCQNFHWQLRTTRVYSPLQRNSSTQLVWCVWQLKRIERQQQCTVHPKFNGRHSDWIEIIRLNEKLFSHENYFNFGLWLWCWLSLSERTNWLEREFGARRIVTYYEYRTHHIHHRPDWQIHVRITNCLPRKIHLERTKHHLVTLLIEFGIKSCVLFLHVSSLFFFLFGKKK